MEREHPGRNLNQNKKSGKCWKKSTTPLFLAFFMFTVEIKNFFQLHILTSKIEPDPLQSNSTLVIVMGNLRGGERAWGTLQSNVLDPSSADLALIIGEFDNSTNIRVQNSSLLKRAKYIWTFKEYEDWGDAVDLISGTMWRERLLEKSLPRSGLFGGVGQKQGSGAIIFMIRWFLVNHLREYGLLDHYERFVLTRSDHYYQCTHDVTKFPVGDKNLWIPPGSDYLGKTDRHLIVGREDVLDALDVYPPLLNDEVGFVAKKLNPEGLLMKVWDKKGFKVNYFDRVMFTVAVKSDKTRWKKAEIGVPNEPCLLQKYENEYDMVQNNCPPIEPPIDCKTEYVSKYFRHKCFEIQKDSC